MKRIVSILLIALTLTILALTIRNVRGEEETQSVSTLSTYIPRVRKHKKRHLHKRRPHKYIDSYGKKRRRNHKKRRVDIYKKKFDTYGKRVNKRRHGKRYGKRRHNKKRIDIYKRKRIDTYGKKFRKNKRHGGSSMQVNGYLNALTQNGLGQQQQFGSSLNNNGVGMNSIGANNMMGRNLNQQAPMGFMASSGLGQNGNAFRGMNMNTMTGTQQGVNNNIIRGSTGMNNQMNNQGIFQNQGNQNNVSSNVGNTNKYPPTSVSPTQQLIHRSTTPNANGSNLLSSSTGDSYRPSESILSMINGQQQFGQYPSMNQKLPPLPQHNIFRNVLNANPQQRQAALIQVRNIAQQNGYDNSAIEQHLQEFLLYEQRYYQIQQQQALQQQQPIQQRTATADDKFGLLGLSNTFASKDSDLTALALGLDLTSLGLNLNASEFLYQNFASPFAEVPPSNVIPDYKLPECYKVTVQLQDFHVDKFTEETLLYIFYTMPRDVLQIVAARELSKRGWKYHKPTQLWLIRDQSVNDFQQNAKAEKGTYFFFDTATWTKKRKSGCVLEYDQLYNAAYFSK
ncbi:predicted protein [Naegleria gruberi]|uniref:Predicted protein n=1 Tax=Naegleria gruberi TaxID=5762 RepID=D2VKU9_NAEGR|nr:uncharacterized protein NAEGRDRAFT_50395 [Naegleria gruberi]EFC42503.1 predicted protein [Naegleria gruberi]|eukprot:XP_002675247.1 predicted protein [Naegleria gruberi strain NEG-M]